MHFFCHVGLSLNLMLEERRAVDDTLYPPSFPTRGPAPIYLYLGVSEGVLYVTDPVAALVCLASRVDKSVCVKWVTLPPPPFSLQLRLMIV